MVIASVGGAETEGRGHVNEDEDGVFFSLALMVDLIVIVLQRQKWKGGGDVLIGENRNILCFVLHCLSLEKAQCC